MQRDHNKYDRNRVCSGYACHVLGSPHDRFNDVSIVDYAHVFRTYSRSALFVNFIPCLKQFPEVFKYGYVTVPTRNIPASIYYYQMGLCIERSSACLLTGVPTCSFLNWDPVLNYS